MARNEVVDIIEHANIVERVLGVREPDPGSFTPAEKINTSIGKLTELLAKYIPEVKW